VTTPFWCLFFACLLPYVWGPISIAARQRQLGVIDNKNPRVQQAQLTGLGARAVGAHKNAFEAIATFAPAVVVAHLAGADPVWSARLALAFLAARVAHGALYLADVDVLRSLVWFAGLACTVGLFVLAMQA
jgi:uncharacterized MAPEG superfamily protein